MEKNEAFFILLRYLILIAIGIPNLYLIYKIFTPLTVSAVFFALNQLYGAVFFPGNIIFFKGYYAAIVPACVAGSAYYLLLILNLSSPIPFFKRIYLLIFSWGSLLILNVLRIILFAVILKISYANFQAIHLFFWYLISTLLVVSIWFLGVWLFSIKAIPFYSDISAFLKEAKH